MDPVKISECLRELARCERLRLAALERLAGKNAPPPGGLFLPRAVLVSQLELAAAILAALGGRTAIVFPGDIVHVRGRVVEHYGDSVMMEFASVRGSAQELIAASAITQVER